MHLQGQYVFGLRTGHRLGRTAHWCCEFKSQDVREFAMHGTLIMAQLLLLQRALIGEVGAKLP